MLWYIIILLSIIIFIFILYDIEQNIVLKDYENIQISNKIYESINDLLYEIPEIYTNDNIIINIVNGNSGMGSQLTIFSQYLYYFYEKNNKIICLPHFSDNNTNFKYHNDKYNQSFFLYFKKNKDINDLLKYKLYFLRANVIDNYPFIESKIPTMNNEINKKYINKFNDDYKLIKNDNIFNDIYKNKKPLIGIHIRSIAQKKKHQPDYLNISIENRLKFLKYKLNNLYGTYSIFIATDVNPYIDLCKSIFNDNNISYINDITRIDNEEDIIANTDIKMSGYKLGSDILNECLVLSKCDNIFVSNSNIPFIISILNPNIIMEEY
jgi:hypothetical protein